MTKEDPPPPPPQREPSPALLRMHSMGVSTTSEGVDNFARVSVVHEVYDEKPVVEQRQYQYQF